MTWQYWIYILASQSRRLYIGVTNDLCRRWYEHSDGIRECYTNRHGIHRLVYYEEHRYILNAIRREKQLKNWRREKKLSLIETMNPDWVDFAVELGWAQKPPQE